MTRPAISIALNSDGEWRAEGSLLGNSFAISASSLWECLELCKQQVWDIEIGHDVTGCGLDLEKRLSERPSAQRSEGVGAADAPPDHRPLTGADDVPVDLLRVVRHLVIEHQSVSLGFVQRRLGLDRAIAGRALAALESEGRLTRLNNGRHRVLRPPAA
jgi:hypothetical protein